MLSIDFEGGINPFDWPDFGCPLCGGNKFTSANHAAVYCDCCNARFQVRPTAGDPGCVVDCFTTKEKGAYIHAPSMYCDKCNKGYGLFDWQDKVCPVDLNHGEMVREPSIYRSWVNPKNIEKFYMILKLGDYCSGWLDGGKFDHWKIGSPTQKQWDAWQETALASR